MPTRAELAENTAVHLLPRPDYPVIATEDFAYAAGPNNAWVLDIRRASVAWGREESRRRGRGVVHGLVPDVEVKPIDGGRPIGVGRAVDMAGGVALMGGDEVGEVEARCGRL